jgi:hypothetical protein
MYGKYYTQLTPQALLLVTLLFKENRSGEE